MRRLKLLLYPLLLLVLTGCPQSHVLEDLGVIIARGTDIAEDNKIETSLDIYQFEAQSENLAKVVTGKSNTFKGALKNANYETNFTLAPGKIQIELYSKELAKKGLSPYIDTISRDPRTPDTMNIAISEDKARDIINLQATGISVNIGQYLKGVIEQNRSDGKTAFPEITLESFMRTLYDVGIDPILPMFALDEESGLPKLKDIALLKDDKYVGKISVDNGVLINLMHHKLKDVIIEFTLPMDAFKDKIKRKEKKDMEHLYVALDVIKSKNKINVMDSKQAHFTTHTEIDFQIVEITNDLDLSKMENIHLLEKVIERRLKNRYEEILSTFKELRIDPIGFGAEYRKSHRNTRLTEDEWRKKIPDMKVDFNFDVNILRHGESY